MIGYLKQKLFQEQYFEQKIRHGDLANIPLYVKSLKNKEITILLPDGTETITTLNMLDIDTKSIHAYDPKKDVEFKL